MFGVERGRIRLRCLVVSMDLVSQLTRRAWRDVLLWLVPSMSGLVCFLFDLRPSPHWFWDAGFLLLTILPLCAALLLWIRLRADLAVGLESLSCQVVRVDEPFPGFPQLEVETRAGRLLLRDLREQRVVADYTAVHELTFARHLGWALALQSAPIPSFPSRVN